MSTILLLGVILLLALAGGHLVKLVKAPEIIGYLFPSAGSAPRSSSCVCCGPWITGFSRGRSE